MTHKLIADIGGTNVRFAQVSDTGISHIEKYLVADYPTIQDAIEQYFANNAEFTFSAVCLAIAAPANEDFVDFSNNHWSFSRADLQTALGLTHLFVINDFTAVAHSLPVLSDEQIVQIGSGSVNPKGNIAVFGPGTGLGVEHLTLTQQGWQTLDGEGGHVDFAPVDLTQMIVWQYIYKKLGRVTAEEVMSGRGIVNIYEALCAHNNQDAQFDDAADITEKALAGSCDICVETLHTFCNAMGTFAGNLAINLATTGGVFIGGGIAARFIDFLNASKFRARFEAKPPIPGYVKNIPTFIINEPDHGLIGAAAYLNQQLRSAS
jgi:glucokinase